MSPIKSCLTCAYRDAADCALTGRFWLNQRAFPDTRCDAQHSGYVPRRSLRQWLYDTFWRV